MAIAGVIIETPALVQVGLPIQVTEYDIQREINAAGSFAVSFPASQTLANQVRSRWRVSLIEEGRTGYLMRRGVVLARNYQVNADGTGILTLAGYTRLYMLTSNSTHFNLIYDGLLSVSDIASNLAGETVTAPASASTIFPKVTFSEMSKMAALNKIAELGRFNLRETFDEDGFELVAWDDVPDSGYRFINVEHAGPELENAAANGMGLIAGTPTIGYDGKDLATRIIPIGVEFDGMPMELDASDQSSPYTIQTGTNPDGSSFFYIEDAAATADVGLIEMQYHRQDVKNPSNDATTRLAAANALYKLAVGELQKRKSDVIAFASEIANGMRIDALPGSRVRIQFRGRARRASGALTWVDLDQDFLIAKRRDASGAAGVRGVSFTLTSPEAPLSDPELPDEVPIPPAPRDPPDPPYPGDPGAGDPGDPGGGEIGDPGGMPTMPDMPAMSDPGAVADLPPFDPNGPNPYQDCCTHGPIITSVDPPVGGGPDMVSGSARAPSITPEDSPFSIDAGNMGGAVTGDKYLIVTWSHSHDGTPDTVTPSAPWLTSVASVNFHEADDGEPRDVSGSLDDIASGGSVRVEVWLGDVDVGSIGSSPQLTLAIPGPAASWPTTPQVGFGGYGLLLHGAHATTPIPQLHFAEAVNSAATHTMDAPGPTSQYLVIGFQRGQFAGGGDSSTDLITAPVGWSRSAVQQQDQELANHSGELLHRGVQLLIAKHSADGETAITWGGTGVYTTSVAIEVKPA